MRVPMRSDGTRSGVNWMRLNVPPSTLAVVFTVSVFASPGTPSIKQMAARQQADRARAPASDPGLRSPSGSRTGPARVVAWSAPCPGVRRCSTRSLLWGRFRRGSRSRYEAREVRPGPRAGHAPPHGLAPSTGNTAGRIERAPMPAGTSTRYARGRHPTPLRSQGRAHPNRGAETGRASFAPRSHLAVTPGTARATKSTWGRSGGATYRHRRARGGVSHDLRETPSQCQRHRGRARGGARHRSCLRRRVFGDPDHGPVVRATAGPPPCPRIRAGRTQRRRPRPARRASSSRRRSVTAVRAQYRARTPEC